MAHKPAKTRVLGVLSGTGLPPSILSAWVQSAQFVVAADGGADSLLDIGMSPDLVVGDMDSLRGDLKPQTRVMRMPDQDFTDCDKLLATIREMGYAGITLGNVEGDLPDHELATYLSAAKSGLACRLIFRRGFGHVLAGPFTGVFVAKGRVSLLPLAHCEGVELTGVKWPLTGCTMDPLGFSSISNHAVDAKVQVGLESGAALLFIEGPIDPTWPE